MRIRDVLLQGSDRLCRVGIDEARVECEHMLMQLLGVNRAELLYRMSSELRSTAFEKACDELTPDQEKQFFAWIDGREKRIPLAYLLGDVFFHSLKLKVECGCLIPRPETECLVEEAAVLMRAAQNETPDLMDLGTGSGAIALALLGIFPKAAAVLVDFSDSALRMARKNAEELGFLSRARLIQSDLFLDIPRELKFDLIVSNPPYLSKEDWRELQPEVAHEPRMALDGGQDGLDFYRKIIPAAKEFLKPAGWLGFEVGAEQSPAVCDELKRYGYRDLRVSRDHQNIERVVFGRFD